MIYFGIFVCEKDFIIFQLETVWINKVIFAVRCLCRICKTETVIFVQKLLWLKRNGKVFLKCNYTAVEIWSEYTAYSEPRFHLNLWGRLLKVMSISRTRANRIAQLKIVNTWKINVLLNIEEQLPQIVNCVCQNSRQYDHSYQQLETNRISCL